MDITDPKINRFINEISSGAQSGEYDHVLTDMDSYAKQNNFPIIGPLVGRLLRQIAMITGARKIFEMGSGYGYSAIWFAGGMPDSGKIVCTEGSDYNKNIALKYFKKAGCEKMIDFQVGDAKEIICKYEDKFDIILNDIDKEQYPEAFELALPRLRSGGLFITDNVLWSGRIFDDEPDAAAAGIIEFNRKLFKSNRIFSSIIPIRDGLGIAVKI